MNSDSSVTVCCSDIFWSPSRFSWASTYGKVSWELVVLKSYASLTWLTVDPSASPIVPFSPSWNCGWVTFLALFVRYTSLGTWNSMISWPLPFDRVSSLTSVAVPSWKASKDPARSFMLGDWRPILDGMSWFYDILFEVWMPRGGLLLSLWLVIVSFWLSSC